jgi:hypothetical protein
MSLEVLHERRSEGIHVQLVWDSTTDDVYVEVRDQSTGDFFLVATDRAKALDAFYHPFFYSAAAAANELRAA